MTKIDQILEKQTRGYNNNDRVGFILEKLKIISDIESMYLGFLSQTEEEKKDLNIEDFYFDEWIKYSPVASFSCLEIYVKSIYKKLIDSGEPYASNSCKLKIQFGLKEAFEIKEKNITIGGFSSHLIPASNFENITDNMNAILGLKDKDKDKDKIIVLLKKKHEENYKLFSESLTLDNCLNDDELIYEKELIKNKNKNSGDFIRDLKSLIKIRNIICHENTIDLNEQKFHCEQSSEIVKKFIYLTEEIINDLEQKPNK